MKKYELKPGEIIPIENDIMFTEVFNDKNNICILEEIIAGYFGYSLNAVRGNLKLQSRKLKKGTLKESSKEIDLLLDYNGEDINIEMSTGLTDDLIERNCVFISNIHGRQLDRGFSTYSEIQPSYQINFFKNYSRNKFKSSLLLIDSDDGWNPVKKLRMDFINMDIGKNMCYNNDVRENLLIRLCKIFTSTTKEELENNLKQGLSKKSSKLLLNTVTRLSGDEKMIKKYIDNKHELEFQSIMEYTTRRCEKAQREAAEAQQKAKEEQQKLEKMQQQYNDEQQQFQEQQQQFQNEQQQFQKEKTQFAKELLNFNISIDDIIKRTGLTKEEINKLK